MLNNVWDTKRIKPKMFIKGLKVSWKIKTSMQNFCKVQPDKFCLEKKKKRSGENVQRKEEWVIKNQKTFMDMRR